MNNKPVAFVSKEDLKNMKTHLCYLHLKPQKNDIPLYLHPVKELTDDEIITLADEHLITVEEYIGMGDYVSYVEGEIEFARAILRKAQESCNGFCGEYECKENKAGCKRKAQEK